MSTPILPTLRQTGSRWRPTLAAALLAVLAAGPAAADAAKDPWQRLNRATYAFNDALDRMLAHPAAKAYKAVVPEVGRRAIGNFVANLGSPTIIVNDALQLKLRDAGSDTARFIVNTIIGIGGLGDPATRMGLASHDEDFGQTLGHWGVGSGPYLVLPLLGPSTLRDAPSRLAIDRYTNLEHYAKSRKTEYGVWALGQVDRRAELLAADPALKQAFDPYALVRDAYMQRREYLVRDGNMPEESYDEPVEDALPPGSAPTPTTPETP